MISIMNKIIWIDDELQFSSFENNEKVFRKSGYDVIKITDPSVLLNYANAELFSNETIACLILDMSWPKAIRKGFTAISGLDVGLELLEKLVAIDSQFKNIKKIVYTITNDETVKAFCKKKKILYLKKTTIYGNDFVSRVISEIIKKVRK